MHARATLAQGVRTEDLAGLQGIVVSRSGTATVIWSAWADAAIFTADDPTGS